MVDFVNNVRSFVNYAIFCELCDWMRFEVDCAKSHHRVISEGLHLIILPFCVIRRPYTLMAYKYLNLFSSIGLTLSIKLIMTILI